MNTTDKFNSHSLTDITPYLPYARQLREVHPLVHCITNTITIWDCANILLAAGGSPTMAHHPLEVAEITAGCRALVCNFGAMDDFDAMMNAAPVAAKLGHPIVVDPVGCGGSTFRRARFRELTEKAQITCLRGNASEIRALARDAATVTGVDSAPEVTASGFEELKSTAAGLARKLNCIVIASGAVDIVTDGRELIEVPAGDAMMSRITGSGCMSSVLLAGHLAAARETWRKTTAASSSGTAQETDTPATAGTPDYLHAAAASCFLMGYCGEVAAARAQAEGRGTMTFHTYLIDEMSLIGM